MLTPMQKGRSIARRTAVVHHLVTNIFRSKRRSPRDTSPDLESRQEFKSIMGDYMCRNHVAPRTKLCVSKGEFAISLKFVDVQRQTRTSLDVLQEATIDDSWNMDGEKSRSEPWIV